MHSPAVLFPLPEQKSKNEGILCKSPTYETGCGINYRFYLSKKAPPSIQRHLSSPKERKRNLVKKSSQSATQWQNYSCAPPPLPVFHPVPIVQIVHLVYRQNPAVKTISSLPLPYSSPLSTKRAAPRGWEAALAGKKKKTLSLFYYTSSGDSQRKETMLNFLPNALFTALSSVSSSAPLFMLIFLTGVSGLSTGST